METRISNETGRPLDCILIQKGQNSQVIGRKSSLATGSRAGYAPDFVGIAGIMILFTIFFSAPAASASSAGFLPVRDATEAFFPVALTLLIPTVLAGLMTVESTSNLPQAP